MRTWGAGLHWSYHDRAWCGFFVFLPTGQVYLRYEFTWRRTSPMIAARDLVTWIDRLERDGKDEFTYCVAQPDLWLSDPKRPGVPEAETFERAGLSLQRGSDDERNGWANLINWIEPTTFYDAKGQPFVEPSLIVHPECKRFLRTFPTLTHEEDDKDTVIDDADTIPAHGARHYLMSRPFPQPSPSVHYKRGSVGRMLMDARADLARNR